MKLPAAVIPYLAQVADDQLTTLAQLQDALAAVQRAASTVNARLGLEFSELDVAHHEIVARVIKANHATNAATTSEEKTPLARALGDERRAENLIENCMQRSRFVQTRVQDLSHLIGDLRRGITELQHDQIQLRAASDAS